MDRADPTGGQARPAFDAFQCEKDKAFEIKQRRAVVLAVVPSYRESIRRLAELVSLGVYAVSTSTRRCATCALNS